MQKSKPRKTTPRILLFDIENAPIVSYIWDIHADGLHSTKFVKEDWYVMCWAAKWLGKKKIYSSALPDFKYDPDKPNDGMVLKRLHAMLDEADIVIAHNGKKFDCRKANARFMIHGMLPPSPYRVIDTLTISRQSFMFTSNRLGDLGNYLGVGSKIETGGFDLWKNCMKGKRSAWNKMIKYCKQDVRLLEKVYLKLRPYSKTHPNVGVYENRPVCPTCGCDSIQYRGYAFTNATRYRRFQCNECGEWGRDAKSDRKSKSARKAK